jgi:hypothetical protein
MSVCVCVCVCIVGIKMVWTEKEAWRMDLWRGTKILSGPIKTWQKDLTKNTFCLSQKEVLLVSLMNCKDLLIFNKNFLLSVWGVP